MKFCKFAVDVHRAHGFLSLDSQKFDYVRRFLEYILLLAMNVHLMSIVIFLLIEREADFAEKMVNFTYLIIGFDGMVKVWYANLRNKLFLSMCEDLRKMYYNIEKKYNIPEYLSAEVVEKKINKFAKIMYFYPISISLTSALVAVFVQPAIDKNTGVKWRRLPIMVWYPFDLKISPNYELIFMLQVIILYCITLGINGHFAYAFTLFTHARRGFMLLQHLIKNIRFEISPEAKECIRNRESLEHGESGNESENEAESTAYHNNEKICLSCSIHAHTEECAFYEKKAHEEMDLQLRDFIVYHADLLSYFKKVNNYGRFLLFCDMLLAIGLLVMGTVALLEVDGFLLYPILGATSWTVIYILVFCWFSSDIKLQSEAVAEAAYLSGWEDGSLSFQRNIATVMARAQRCESLTVGNLYPADLDLYITLMQAAYSNFTILRSMTGRD